MKAFTDIEQSKKLAKILPIESADGFYESQYSSSTDTWETLLFTGNKWASPEVVIPCWSLAKLLDILPNTIKRKNVDDSHNRYDVHIAKYQFVEGITMYQISYGNCFTLSGGWSAMVTSKESEDLIDCIINILEWIKKNDFINYYE